MLVDRLVTICGMREKHKIGGNSRRWEGKKHSNVLANHNQIVAACRARWSPTPTLKEGSKLNTLRAACHQPAVDSSQPLLYVMLSSRRKKKTKNIGSICSSRWSEVRLSLRCTVLQHFFSHSMSVQTAHAARFWKTVFRTRFGMSAIKSSTKIGKNVLHNNIKFWVKSFGRWVPFAVPNNPLSSLRQRVGDIEWMPW